jgi:hypothetical protein
VDEGGHARRWGYLRHMLIPDRCSGVAALRRGADWRRFGARLGAHRNPAAQKAHAIMRADRDRRE